MSGGQDVQTPVERFYAFERREGLMRREIDGCRYWHLVRFPVYHKLILPLLTTVGSAHPDRRKLGGGPFSRLRVLCGTLRDLLFFNPSLSRRKCEILFALEPRQATLQDGSRISLLLDFFIDRLGASAGVLELSPVEGSGPALCGRHGVFRVCGLSLRRRMVRRSSGFRRVVTAIRKESQELADGFSAEFGVEVSAKHLAGLIEKALLRRKAALDLFRSWLRRLGVRCLVVGVHYSRYNLILTEAAHDLGLEVVELQHGLVIPEHVAYNLPEPGSPYAPDVLLSWGRCWERGLRNFPRKEVVPVGYPYLEHFRGVYPPRCQAHARKTVLFVSQGTVGQELSRLAVELHGLLPEADILYKLHPSESRTWRTLYPELVGSGVEVVENTARNIYSCFGDADAMIGSYSTALIEGFMWGLRAYVLRSLYGSGIMRGFAGSGQVVYVDSAADLANRLREDFLHKTVARPLGEGYWVPGAAGRIAAWLDCRCGIISTEAKAICPEN